MLHVYLFGGLHLRWEDDPLPPIRSRPARSLFAYLVTHPDRPHTRDLLVGLFWPDMPDAQARRRLSQALWQIRQVLKPLPSPQPYLLADAETVQFNPEAPYWVDVDAFEEKLGQARETENPSPGHARALLEEAVALYTGDFLAGYYDDWTLIERERLRDRYLEALNRLVRLCKAQGLYEEALTHATQLARHDPLRETAHREVMRLCFLLGRPNEALQLDTGDFGSRQKISYSNADLRRLRTQIFQTICENLRGSASQINFARVQPPTEIYQQQADGRGEARARISLGNALRRLGQYEAARAQLEVALDCYVQLDDPPGQAKVQGFLGIVSRQQGDMETAERCYRRALEVSRDIGDVVGEARSLMNLAVLLYYQGEISQVLKLFDQTATIFTRSKIVIRRPWCAATPPPSAVTCWGTMSALPMTSK